MFCCRHHQSISHKHRHAQQAYRTNWDPSYTNIGTNWSRINTQYGLFRRIKVKVKTNTRENWKKTYPSGTHERSIDPLEKSRWEIVEPPSSTNCRLVWSHCTSGRPRSRASNLRLLSPVKHDPAPRVRWVREEIRRRGCAPAARAALPGMQQRPPPLLSCEQPALRRQVANELGGEKATG